MTTICRVYCTQAATPLSELLTINPEIPDSRSQNASEHLPAISNQTELCA